jgi:peptidoglycan/xylan/chitin deacetylase (PgdA/CDA1 family)
MFVSLTQKVVRAARMARNRLFNLVDPPVVVLIYHRVTTLAADPQLLAVTPENFRSHLQYLKQNYNLVRFEDQWSDVKKPAVAITFDDGYADNALEALPIIEKEGVPVTFFVTTGTVGTRQEFWWDELERLILGAWPYPGQFTLDDSRFRQVWPTGSVSERETLYSEIHPLMKMVDANCRADWLMQLRYWADAGEEGREINRTMTLEELRRLADSKWVTIGAHTITHTSLSSLPVEEQREEIIGSRRHLENWLGQEIRVFSYPFGAKRDYTRDSVALCKEVGFVKVAANVSGQAHRWTDPYRIPRQLVRNWDRAIFARNLESFRVL